MPWRIVVQPNGKYARFSDIPDGFTHANMTRDQAIKVCGQGAAGVGAVDAEEKVLRAEREPGRYLESLNTIRIVHGDAEMAEAKREIEGEDHGNVH